MNKSTMFYLPKLLIFTGNPPGTTVPGGFYIASYAPDSFLGCQEFFSISAFSLKLSNIFITLPAASFSFSLLDRVSAASADISSVMAEMFWMPSTMAPFARFVFCTNCSKRFASPRIWALLRKISVKLWETFKTPSF